VPPRLHRTVRSLGLVSLLTDASSEMIYPLLPASLITGVLWQRFGATVALGAGAALAALAALGLLVLVPAPASRAERSS
jgi:hypothetical protein